MRLPSESESPLHRVAIEQPFAVGVYEVTRAEFRRFVRHTDHDMGSSCRLKDFETMAPWRPVPGRNWLDPGFRQAESHPVVCVGWLDAQNYVRWLSERPGQQYRLLSEAEWEYVARAGTDTAWYGEATGSSQCNYANAISGTDHWKPTQCDDDYPRTAPVGSFFKNRFGLYDVLGNVAEWSEDCWNSSYAGAPTDGSAWQRGKCSTRVVRGGSWTDAPSWLRSADRRSRGIHPSDDGRIDDLGFRVARELDL